MCSSFVSTVWSLTILLIVSLPGTSAVEAGLDVAVVGKHDAEVEGSVGGRCWAGLRDPRPLPPRGRERIGDLHAR